jgi:predicted RNA-binding Zn-ribbon protein involved in translation (DUF1610 family)
MEERTKHTYRTNLYQFIKDILVECPSCGEKAIVHTKGYTILQQEARDVRVVCGACGYNKVLDRKGTRELALLIGAPVDPFFQLPLWLKTKIGAQLLWAYNLEHLDFLVEHVGAKLRERNGFKHQVKSIGARLPRWMTTASSRSEMLKALEKMRSIVQ